MTTATAIPVGTYSTDGVHSSAGFAVLLGNGTNAIAIRYAEVPVLGGRLTVGSSGDTSVGG